MAPLVLHVAGARPNLPKLAPVVEALRSRGVRQLIVHTGQHHDDELSGVFFRQLDIPDPDVNLGVGPGRHGAQTAAVLVGLEQVLVQRQPDLVVVYGDVNSTLAATLAAVKLGIEVAHVEAGLRSFDTSMPEEVNRLVVDRLAALLLAPSADALEHLDREGVPAERVHLVGNPMIDTLLRQMPRIEQTPVPVPDLEPHRYLVATLHRPSNVDTTEDAAELGQVLCQLADRVQVVIPLHPRARRQLAQHLHHPRLQVVDPLGYREFLALVRQAGAVVTDSGGVQEETTVLGVPCLTVRNNTERPVTISHGTNRLVGRGDLLSAAETVLATGRPREWSVPALWDGHAGPRIADVLARHVTG